MAQYLRPNGNITQGLWYGSVNTNNPSLDIDEVTRNDSDYAYSQANQTTLGQFSLSDVFTPSTGTRTARYALRKSGNKDLTVVVRIMEGTTTIGGWTHVNPATTFTLFQQTVTASVTNYNNLHLELEVTVNAGGNTICEVSWFEFEIPNAFAQGTPLPCYMYGSANVSSSVPSYLAGPIEFPVDSQTPVFLWGANWQADYIPAYMTGPILATGQQTCYLDSYGQDLEPDADIAVHLWVNELGDPELFPSVADDSDATYATIDYCGVGDYFEVAIADPGDIPDNDMYYEWRAWRISGSQVISMKAELLQGETLIAVDNRVLSDTPTTYRRDLSVAERASITSPIDLRMRFTVTGVS